MSYNLHEQSGLNDGVAMLLRAMGIEMELNGSVERMITLTPEPG